MNQSHQKSLAFLRQAERAFIIAAAFIWGPGAPAAVTKVTLDAVEKVYEGDCPAKILFKGSITVDEPAKITYIFTRSDGAVDTVPKVLKFSRPGTKLIATSWTLGGAMLLHYKGWQAVEILTPTHLESAHADFEIHCDPPLNSAKSAHGNTDWHLDTANTFLFGKDMAGNQAAANYAPANWTKNHIHVGLTNTSHFYNDKARSATGDDTDLTNGIDTPMLFFYAGHGNPTAWCTLGDFAHQTGVSLANENGGGQLRYYWQCSCEVFAHGPRACTNGVDYSEPEKFDGSHDSPQSLAW